MTRSHHRWLTARGRSALLCVALALVGGCDSAGSSVSSEGAPDGTVEAERARGQAMLAGEEALPTRSEVVALTDRLSIAASTSEDDERAGQDRWLAASLRELIWRRDRATTDAREALELYAATVRDAAGTALSCRADRAAAALHGELAGDAAETFRTVYLALERQAIGELSDDAMESCVRDLRSMLAVTEAYRPTGADWDALEREAAASANTQLSLAGTATAGAGTASASASGSAGAGGGPPDVKEEVVVVPDPSMISEGRVNLTQVQPYSFELGGRVVLHLSGPAHYSTGMLAPDAEAGKGHRLYLDLDHTRIKGPKLKIEGSGLIERVRLGKRKGGHTRVVVDLKAASTRRIFYLPDPFRVIIDVNAKGPVQSASPARGQARGVRRVALDPGHGGWDAGAIGPTGLREKDVALDVAHRAAPALAAELGIETMLTRDTDVFIELDERTARANAFQSDLFVSIHCNATDNGQASGVEVFILDPSREQDRRALESVARENHARRKKVDPMLLGSQLTNIAAGLGMRTTQSSEVFADLLRRSTLASVGTRFPDTVDHGVKTAGFFVLVGAAMPAVLYETSFISNPEDEARLATADYRQKLADAIVNAVKAYDEGLE